MTLGQSQKTFNRNSYLLNLVTQLPPVTVSVVNIRYISGIPFSKYKMAVSDLNNFTLIEKVTVTVTIKFATGGQEIGEKVVFAVTFGGDVEEGAPVAIKLYRDGADTQRDRPVKEWRTAVEESKAKAKWVCACRNDPENPLTEKPKFFYTVESPRCAAARSGNLEVSQSLCVEAVDGNGYYLGGGMEYELKHRSGECERGNCAGRIEKTGLIPGKWEFVLTGSGQGRREGENRNMADAQDENTTVLEFALQEVIDSAVEVHTGSRVRIIVKEGALQHSDDAGNKASGGTRT